MQTFKTKTSALAYAKACGWTEADSERAIKSGGIKPPMDEITLLNAMVRFSGPELLLRQKLQAAQKAQVTVKTKRVNELSKNYEEMVTDYEAQMHLERSQFISLLEVLYGIAQKFGYQDDWIEVLIKTYQQHMQQNQPPITKKKAA
jgi:hypothetical protein